MLIGQQSSVPEQASERLASSRGPITAWLRFRRFRTRLVVLILSLLVVVLSTTYGLVSRANYANVISHSKANLAVGARVYDNAIRQRVESLANSASVMSQDFAIRQVMQSRTFDIQQLSNVLRAYTQRIHAPVIALLGTNGSMLANSELGVENENRGPFGYLIRLATTGKKDQASGFAYLNNDLHALVVKPFYADYPRIAAWFGLAFPIDRLLAEEIHAVTQLDVTFLSTTEMAAPRILATTLPSDEAQAMAKVVAEYHGIPPSIETVDLLGESFVTLFKSEELLGDDPVTVVLQRPLRPDLVAARSLEMAMLTISLGALTVAGLIAVGIARGVSQPVQALAAHTRQIAAGNYTVRLLLDRDDELGELAAAFNRMSAGLAERDRVRDLLGKVVSPAIATELLKSALVLGGEEREVTVLFSDLRDFTTLSEKLSPVDLLDLLNRYLDRMSAIVEKHGGVIDKYIGDAIMALYGAPVVSPDAADNAIATARDMVTALATLNAELLAGGKPSLAVGIGINTARVVAGNMGSRSRLNYTVVGDGVNLASRLESLTKDPAYATRIIISEATLRAARHPPSLRPLGRVTVKGKTVPISIYALDMP